MPRSRRHAVEPASCCFSSKNVRISQSTHSFTPVSRAISTTIRSLFIRRSRSAMRSGSARGSVGAVRNGRPVRSRTSNSARSNVCSSWRDCFASSSNHFRCASSS